MLYRVKSYDDSLCDCNGANTAAAIDVVAGNVGRAVWFLESRLGFTCYRLAFSDQYHQQISCCLILRFEAVFMHWA